ncbi:MAG: polyprenyl synthetase family protein [Proteobacteria bacterium]|nr:polyprenyl synthetase family protein [Pseudomonadota bacterium]
MLEVNQYLREQLNSEVVLINQISAYIISNGGKRLRPLLLILICKALRYQGKQHINLAAVIELIHTATLLHDDVVDESDMRRGEKTSHEIWGNSASVLVGDFLYSKSFQMMVKVNNMQVMDILSNATNRISEGEVQQLLNIGNLQITENDYFQIIENKTAKLFEAACELAAVICEQNQVVCKSLAEFGTYLGCAFQIADDVLDYAAANEATGKNLGDDLREGKLTLPLIYLLNKGTKKQQQIITQAINNPKEENFIAVKQCITQSEALQYTQKHAIKMAEKAKESLTCLKNSTEKQYLLFLCDFAWQRNK